MMTIILLVYIVGKLLMFKFLMFNFYANLRYLVMIFKIYFCVLNTIMLLVYTYIILRKSENNIYVLLGHCVYVMLPRKL